MPTAASAWADDVFLGLNMPRLVETLGMRMAEDKPSPVTLSVRWPSATGPVMVAYRVCGGPEDGAKLLLLKATVQPTPASAHEVTRELRRAVLWRSSILPAEPERAAEGLGNEGWFYPHANESKYGSVVFGRRNIVMYLGWEESVPGTGLALARQIDALIRDDRQIAPLGTFAEMPAIVSAGVPATLPASSTPGRTADGRPTGYERSYVTITPQFRGLGDLDNLRFVVLGRQDNGQTWGRLTQTTPEGKSQPKVYKIDTTERGGIPKLNEVQEDGRFLMEVPRKTGALKLKLIAATEDNLIVTKEVQVTVVPAD